jgi:hypothetical protein
LAAAFSWRTQQFNHDGPMIGGKGKKNEDYEVSFTGSRLRTAGRPPDRCEAGRIRGLKSIRLARTTTKKIVYEGGIS